MHTDSFILFVIALSHLFFFPSFPALAFVPYIVNSWFQQTKPVALQNATICGIITDLFSSSPCFGITGLNYYTVTYLLYNQSRTTFKEQIATLPLVTFCFSLASDLLQVFFRLLFHHPIRISYEWVLSDLLCMPVLDASYAFVLSIILYLIKKVIHYRRHKKPQKN